MIYPTIHLNGTSANSLIEGLLKAHDAVTNALGAVNAAAPHGRDYYVQEPGAYEKARAEHDSRRERLRSVAKELEDLIEHIDQFRR